MIIILAAVVILTLSKNNPIESAKEATFKEDVRTFQDELAMYISKDYQRLGGQRDTKINADKYTTDGVPDSVYTYISSFSKKYENKFVIKNDQLVYKEKSLTIDEKNWIQALNVSNGKNPMPEGWSTYIEDVTEDGVPIPKGFTYKEGTKETGTVIEDNSHNEFVWIPVDDQDNYKKDLNFPTWYMGSMTEAIEYATPQNLDETADVKEYGGFYIGRYEATVPDGDAEISTQSKPTCKYKHTVWSNINNSNAKQAAERMYIWSEDSVVQSGLLTGKAWDTTCHWIEDYVKTIDSSSSLNDSRYYGNYKNSLSPADVTGYGNLQVSGYSEMWKTKNVYDLAGNVWEWTNERVDYGIRRGGSYDDYGDGYGKISMRKGNTSSFSNIDGFRIRLYIKTT